jgi:hypothetical protein
VVDHIMDKRVKTKKKVVEYLVHWRGYPSSEDSWEPKSKTTPLLSKTTPRHTHTYTYRESHLTSLFTQAAPPHRCVHATQAG